MILVIEDDPLIRELTKEILLDNGLGPVLTAEDGIVGMATIQQQKPDLVITDIVMPDKDGVAVIRELKKEFPTLPIIAISGGGFNSPQYYLKIAEQLGSRNRLTKMSSCKPSETYSPKTIQHEPLQHVQNTARILAGHRPVRRDSKPSQCLQYFRRTLHQSGERSSGI